MRNERGSYKRQIQSFGIRGSINASDAEARNRPISFLKLQNCVVDKRLGALVPRAGSLTETIANGLGVPNGMGQLTTPTSAALIPISRTLLASFAGAFRKLVGSTWSSVLKDSNCSFATDKQYQFGQLGTRLYIAGGKPAKWNGSGNVEPIGIPAPTVAPTTSVTGTGITAATGWYYMFTYYNSTTGLESDWSLSSSSTGVVSNKTVVVTTPTTAAQAPGVDKKRIYRTLDGGSPYGPFYYSGEVAIGTATYNDTVTDAALAQDAAPYGDRDVPPNSYIMAVFASRLFLVNADNPYLLHFSDAYIGSDVDPEYFPADFILATNEPITGLFVLPGQLLLFHPRSISRLTGTSEADFRIEPFLSGRGTIFPNSIASDGETLVWLAEEGVVAWNEGKVRRIDREIAVELTPILLNRYNRALYVSTVYSPALKQFLFLISASATTNAPWQTVSQGALSTWKSVVGGIITAWTNPSAPANATTNRCRIWGWSAELSGDENVWMSHNFPQFPDLNSQAAYPIHMYHPTASSDTLDPQQDRTYICYYTGTEGRILGAFRRDATMDDGSPVEVKILTGKLVPGNDEGGFKRVSHIQFSGAYLDPTSDGKATLSYLLDFDDPHLRSFEQGLIPIDDATDCKPLPQGRMRHMHLYINDTSSNPNKILLQELQLHYRERNNREATR